MKYLITGLGNPGPEYASTRHNIGFLVLDALAEAHGAPFEPGRYAEVCSFRMKGKTLTLIKPQTYMNLSGKALRYWMQELKVETQNIMVVTDDVAIPFGAIRIRKKGSDGGHNGLKNIQDLIGTTEYPRLRMGLGNEYPRGAQVDFVLSPFDEQEAQQLKPWIDKAVKAIEAFVLQGMEPAMNQFNG